MIVQFDSPQGIGKLQLNCEGEGDVVNDSRNFTVSFVAKDGRIDIREMRGAEAGGERLAATLYRRGVRTYLNRIPGRRPQSDGAVALGVGNQLYATKSFPQRTGEGRRRDARKAYVSH